MMLIKREASLGGPGLTIISIKWEAGLGELIHGVNQKSAKPGWDWPNH